MHSSEQVGRQAERYACTRNIRYNDKVAIGMEWIGLEENRIKGKGLEEMGKRKRKAMIFESIELGWLVRVGWGD